MRPDVALIARFRGDLARVVEAAQLDDACRLGLAVSGGPDSMALLALAQAAVPGRIAVATVDHQLRDGSAAEAALVADACAGLGVPHATLLPAAPIAGASLQRQARAARYAALTAWATNNGIAALLTAHHADDQAETLLMRLNRASGIAGLSAIRAVRRDEVPVLRPLLGWRRAALRSIAARSGLPFVDDPANADPRHDRTRARALLAATPALDSAALAASAGYFADAEEVIALEAERAWAQRWRGDALNAADLPRELRRRLVRRGILEARTRLGIAAPAFDLSANVEPLLDALAAGRGAVQGGVKVTPRADGWRFVPAPPRRG